ncbi:NUDIX domain-containing protein [Patescibacteria group bacterium]
MPKTAIKYKFAVIATDVVIFTIKDEKLQVLLIKMKKKPFSEQWACPGGLVKSNEDVDISAKRQLKTKAGVDNIYLEQLYTFGKVRRDPFGRVVSVAYFALIPNANIKLKTTKEYTDVKWFNIDKLPKLAYDHLEIIQTAVERLKAKLTYTNIIYGLLPKDFTLTELQKIYESILNKKLDKRNFRKKILSLKLIKKVNKQKSGEAYRPADLYTFIKRSPQVIEIL